MWGPPGTGKTTTLAHIVSELLAQGLRVLVLSTTNAALDQALAKIAADLEMGKAIDAGDVVRIGRSDGPPLARAPRRGGPAQRRAPEGSGSAREPPPGRGPGRAALRGGVAHPSDADAPVSRESLRQRTPRLRPHLAGIFSSQRAAEPHDCPPAELAGLIRRRMDPIGPGPGAVRQGHRREKASAAAAKNGTSSTARPWCCPR